MIHKRFICPVGQGCFSIESIGSYTVVYDCGSITAYPMIESYIDRLSFETDKVDLLFISHFDKDHVNSIRYLLNRVKVIRAITPIVPKDLRFVYGIYNKAYTSIMSLLTENNVEVYDFDNNEDDMIKVAYQNIWEWVAKSMMRNVDFMSFRDFLVSIAHIDTNRLEDADYLENEKEKINNAFKVVFGIRGPNEKGLVVLSQRCKNVYTEDSWIYQGGYCHSWFRKTLVNCNISSCLYVGDANLKKRANTLDVQKCLKKYGNDESLLLIQIPHHGSNRNCDHRFEKDFPASYYFVNDKDSQRIQRNKALYKSLTEKKQLQIVRGLERDIIMTKTYIV